MHDGNTLLMMVRKFDLPCIANPEPSLVKNLPTPLGDQGGWGPIKMLLKE